MSVQEQAVATTPVNCATTQFICYARDGRREVWVHRQFDIGWSGDGPDEAVVCSLKIGNGLPLSLGPKILPVDRVIETIKTPKPIARERRIGARGNGLGGLDGSARG